MLDAITKEYLECATRIRPDRRLIGQRDLRRPGRTSEAAEDGCSGSRPALLGRAARAIGAVRVEVVDGDDNVNLHFADASVLQS